MKKIIIINGPNLNLLGKREPDVYGDITFEEFYEDLREKLEDTHLKIALNLELVTIHDKVENRLIKTRSHYDSRILTLVPHM